MQQPPDKNVRPPRAAQWIMSRLSIYSERCASLGDFEEDFRIIAQTKGKLSARRWYWSQVLVAVPGYATAMLQCYLSMAAAHLKIARRALTRNRAFSLINILGLGFGITAALLILIYVRFEKSYDRFNTLADRIHRVEFYGTFGGNDLRFPSVAAVTSGVMTTDFPEIDTAVRIYASGPVDVRRSDRTFKEKRLAYTDEAFFKLFSIPMILGDPDSALREPDAIVISGTTARKYFGAENPLDQQVIFGENRVCRITGVFQDIPENAHFHFDLLVSLASIEDAHNPRWLDNMSFHTYVLLHKNADPNALEAKFPKMIDTYIGAMYRDSGKDYQAMLKSGMRLAYSLRPLTDIHLGSDLSREFESGGDNRRVLMMAMIAASILLLAVVNFINLSTACFTRRAREVGIKKVLGSRRTLLIGQLLSESVITCLAALILACLMVAAVFPLFCRLVGKNLSSGLLPPVTAGLILSAAGLLLGVISGIYPALVLSSNQPVVGLKSGLASGKRGRSLRNGLVIFQYTVSLCLLLGTLVVARQIRFIQHKHLGFEREQVLIIPDPQALDRRAEAFKSELLSHAGISQVTLSSFLPVDSRRLLDVMIPEGARQGDGSPLQRWTVDEDYIATLGMTVTAGRNFSRDYSTDTNAAIINQCAARHFGWDNPVGKRVFDGAPPDAESFTVVGVVKDFHYESLKTPVAPLILIRGHDPNGLALRLHPREMEGAVNHIQEVWRRMANGSPLEFHFMDDRFNTMYHQERKTRLLLGIFSGLALIIGCLGLSGLATYEVERRTRELGVRKVLGASGPHLMLMILTEFSRPILISCVLALPIGYAVMNRWLEQFAYRTTPGTFPFLVSAALLFSVAWMTIAVHAVRVARMDPVHTLRQE